MGNAYNFTSEASLLEPVAAYFKRKSFRLQAHEMRFYDYRVDLYGFSRSEARTIAVELKMYKWRRAFEQAIVYQLCADLVYIAMPLRSAGRVDIDLLSAHGIGLLAVGETGRCRQVLGAQQSAVVQETYTRSYISRLNGRVKWQQ